MITSEQIPDEVIETAAKYIFACEYGTVSEISWEDLSNHDVSVYKSMALRVILAAFNAWPNAHFYPQPCFIWNGKGAAYILPVSHKMSKDDL